MTKTRAKEIFQSVTPSKNVMTPHIMGFLRRGDYVIELSRGKGIFTPFMYGVTVVNLLTKKQGYDLSACFDTEQEARDYINTLGNE